MQHFRYSRWDSSEHAIGLREDELMEWAQRISRIINAPMVIDHFNRDHDARRKWRTTMEQKHGEEALDFLYENKLRKNIFNINTILAHLEVLLSRADDLRAEKVRLAIQKFRQGYRSVVAGYDDMNIEQKKEAVLRLDPLYKELLGNLQFAS